MSKFDSLKKWFGVGKKEEQSILLNRLSKPRGANLNLNTKLLGLDKEPLKEKLLEEILYGKEPLEKILSDKELLKTLSKESKEAPSNDYSRSYLLDDILNRRGNSSGSSSSSPVGG